MIGNLANFDRIMHGPTGNRTTTLRRRQEPGSREYALVYNQAIDRFRFYASPDGTSYSVVTANNFGSPAAGVWYFVTAWYDGVNLNISVNNGAADSINHVGGIFDGSQPFGLGDRGANLYSLNGSLDETAIYKRTLTSAERSWLYNGGTGRAYTDLSSPPSSTPDVTYTYGDTAHIHAVTSLSTGETYTYDANGNMICRVENGTTYKQDL